MGPEMGFTTDEKALTPLVVGALYCQVLHKKIVYAKMRNETGTAAFPAGESSRARTVWEGRHDAEPDSPGHPKRGAFSFASIPIKNLEQAGGDFMKSQKHDTVKKYWIILICWFFSPILVKNVMKISMSSSALMFGFVPPYWLFVMAASAYERHVIMSYLEKRYPYEVKRRKGKTVFSEGDKLDFNFLVSFSPPNDGEWKSVQSNFKKFIDFVSVSFGAVICFGLVYGLLGI